MRDSILDLIECPKCHRSDLRCESFKDGDRIDELEDGLLLCNCGESFPVILGVPRMLPTELRSMLYKEYDWFFEKYANQISTKKANSHEYSRHHKKAPSEAAKELTAHSFGYEWNEFSSMVSHYEKNFCHYFEGLDPPAFFRNKLVLDAGCGMGRHSYYALKYGAKVVGLDLSRAIDAAYHNSNQKDAHFVQGDIYSIPLKAEQFDIVYCLGVLHHLPNPEAGFRELVKYVKPGGLVHIYVYHKLEHSTFWQRFLLKAVTGIRKITTKTPYPLLKQVCLLWASLFYLGLIIPARCLKKIPGLPSLAGFIPLHRYSDSPFNAIYKDTFDRFSAPIENRYNRQDVVEWFESSGLSDIRVLGGTGWRVSGRKVDSLQNNTNSL